MASIIICKPSFKVNLWTLCFVWYEKDPNPFNKTWDSTTKMWRRQRLAQSDGSGQEAIEDASWQDLWNTFAMKFVSLFLTHSLHYCNSWRFDSMIFYIKQCKHIRFITMTLLPDCLCFFPHQFVPCLFTQIGISMRWMVRDWP